MKFDKDSLTKALSDPKVHLSIRSIPRKIYESIERRSVRLSYQYDWMINIVGNGQEIRLTSDCPFRTREEAIQCGKAVLGCLRSKFEPVIR